MSSTSAETADPLRSLEQRAASSNPAEQLRAIQELEGCGPAAVDLLAQLLYDKTLSVRSAAAAALGRIGDDRATQVLLEALRRSLVRGSGRWHLVTGVLTAVGWGFLVVLTVCLAGVAGGGLISNFGEPAIAYFAHRRQQGEFVKAVTEALGTIVERSPTPQLGSVVQDLRAVAADRLQQNPATRDACHRTAERIEELVRELRKLPIAAGTPASPSDAALPRPAAGSEPAPETLPTPAARADRA